MLQDLVIGDPYTKPSSEDQLYLICEPLVPHDLYRNLELILCMVSERAWRDTAYHMTQKIR